MKHFQCKKPAEASTLPPEGLLHEPLPLASPSSCHFLKGSDVMSFVWCLVCAWNVGCLLFFHFSTNAVAPQNKGQGFWHISVTKGLTLNRGFQAPWKHSPSFKKKKKKKSRQTSFHYHIIFFWHLCSIPEWPRVKNQHMTSRRMGLV